MPIGSQYQSSFKRIHIKALHVRGAQPLYFSSIITDFTDSWTPKWSPTSVYGRMDPVSFYSGTTRELTVGFRVISDNESEAALNMAKIQKLIQWQYPTYASHGGGLKLLTAPPYFEFSFLNILGGGRKLQGYINGALQINPGFQAKDQPQYFSAAADKLYFSDVNVVLRFQVLHAGMIGNVIESNAVRFKNGTEHTAYPYGSPVTLPGSNNGGPSEGTSDTTIYLNQTQAEQDAASRQQAINAAKTANVQAAAVQPQGVGSGGGPDITRIAPQMNNMPAGALNEGADAPQITMGTKAALPVTKVSAPDSPRVAITPPVKAPFEGRDINYPEPHPNFTGEGSLGGESGADYSTDTSTRVAEKQIDLLHMKIEARRRRIECLADPNADCGPAIE